MVGLEFKHKLQTKGEAEAHIGLQDRGKCLATMWEGGKEQGCLGN